MPGRLIFCLAALLLLATGALAQVRESRVALLIGNAAYRHAGGLRNPVNDAEAMAEALKGFGFDVIKVTNADRSQMVRAMTDFARRLRPDGVGLFFYAGHGIQVAGNNYLIPIDADIQEEYDTSFLGINVSDVLRVMEGAGSRFNMLILDACRDNPFERRIRSTGSRGLAAIEAPRGALIAYATAPGKTAADGDGTNGLFTAEFLKAMGRTALTVDEMLKEAGAGVEKASGNKQVPWINSSYRGRFHLHADAASSPAPAAAAVPMQATPEAMELAAWSAVAAATSAGLVEAFLKEFPDGRFAGLARAKLEEVKTTQAARKVAPAPAPPVPAPPALTSSRAAYVARRTANVRSGPSPGSEVLGGLAAGDAVEAIGTVDRDGWLPIAFAGGTAYVAATMLQASDTDGVKRPAPPAPATIEPRRERPLALAHSPPPAEIAEPPAATANGGWMREPRGLSRSAIRAADGRLIGWLVPEDGAMRIVLDHPPLADRYGPGRVVQWSQVFRRGDQLWIKGVRKVSAERYPLVSMLLASSGDASFAGTMTLAADQPQHMAVQLIESAP